MPKPTLDIPYGDNPRQKLDIYPAGDTVVIFWPGGSWKSGDKSQYRFVGRALAKMGFTAVLANYRLYPEVRFPSFVEDGAAALKWVKKTYGPEKIILMGHSAGAFIAAVLALDANYVKPFSNDDLNIKGVIGLSGPYDFNPRPDLQAIFAESDPKQWKPINLVTQPSLPVLFIQGRWDPIVGYKNAIALAKKVNSGGGQANLRLYGYLEHYGTVLPFLPFFPWVAPIRRDVKQFIESL